MCSLYLPPVDPITKCDLTGFIRELTDPFVLVGDFNGRHPLWDEGPTNSRGILIASFISTVKMGLLHPSISPYASLTAYLILLGGF